MIKNKLSKIININIDENSLTKEEQLFNYLYSKLVVEDFVCLIKENIININCEDYIYSELTFENIFNLIKDEVFKNLSNETKILNIASGAGELVFLLNYMYNFKILCGLENIFEMYSLSKELLNKYKISKFYDKNKENITFIMNDPLLVDFSQFDFIIIDYNNKNKMFERMLSEKIKKECKKETIIIKFVSRFREDEKIKIFKKLTLKNKHKREFCIYFYKLK